MDQIFICGTDLKCLQCGRRLSKGKLEYIPCKSQKNERIVQLTANVHKCSKCRFKFILHGTEVKVVREEKFVACVSKFQKVNSTNFIQSEDEVKKEPNEEGKQQRNIRNSKNDKRKCEGCKYWLKVKKKRFCSIHYLETKKNDVCSRFNSGYIILYQGGSCSPK